MQQPLLAFLRNGDALKLGMADDDSIVITSSNPGTELLAPGFFKVTFGCDEDIGRRIQTQKLGCPLLSQMIRDDDHTLGTQTEPLGFHRSSHHLKGLARTYLMGEQRITAIKNVGDSVALVIP